MFSIRTLLIVQVSVMPRCTSVGAVLKAGSPLEGLKLFVAAGWEAVGTIFTESFVSLVGGTGTVDFATASSCSAYSTTSDSAMFHWTISFTPVYNTCSLSVCVAVCAGRPGGVLHAAPGVCTGPRPFRPPKTSRCLPASACGA
jgi:hypothetical protein